jgi:ankyrin repeat protein
MKDLRKILEGRRGHRAISLVQRGLDINSYDEGGWSLLHHAACFGDVEFLEYLLSQGVEVDKPAFCPHPYVLSMQTPLHALVFGAERGTTPERAVECAKRLVGKGAEINAQDSTGETPLHYIASCGRSTEALNNLAEYLIDVGADIDIRDNSGYAPIHTLALNGWNIDFLHLLIEKGASIKMTNNYGETPLRIAYRQNKEEVFKILSKFDKGGFRMRVKRFFGMRYS